MADPLDRPATPRVLLDLAEAGAVDGASLMVALGRIDALPTLASTVRAVRTVMGLVGALALVAAVALLVAANLSAVPGPALIGGCMALVLLAGAGAVRVSLSTFAGQALALVSGLLIGPMLAVFGQVYQSGADAWQLFALWSVLLLGSVVATGSHGLIVLWVLLLHTTAALLAEQHFGVDIEDASFVRFVVGLVGLDAVVIAFLLRTSPGSSARRILLALALCTMAPTTLSLWLGHLRGDEGQGPLLGTFVVIVHVAAAWFFRRRHLDVPSLALLGASAMVHITTMLVSFADFELLDIFFVGAAVITQAVLLAIALRAAAKAAP